jgi:hypothetical protein
MAGMGGDAWYASLSSLGVALLERVADTLGGLERLAEPTVILKVPGLDQLLQPLAEKLSFETSVLKVPW